MSNHTPATEQEPPNVGDNAAPQPGDATTTLPEDRKRLAAEEQASAEPQTSRTGAAMGRPGAEHGAYGMRRDDVPGSDNATERQVRGVEPEKPRPGA